MTGYIFLDSFVLSSNLITSLWEEGFGRFASHLLVLQHFVASCFSTVSVGAKGGQQCFTVVLLGDIFYVSFHNSCLVHTENYVPWQNSLQAFY